METRANHVLIGAFTLLGLLLALGLGLWASKWTTAGAWSDYEIHFSQAVTGLSTGGQVQYNGIAVGTVRELRLNPEDPRQVIARIRIQADAPVKQDTVARLALTGLTGVAIIQLSGGSPESPRLVAREGERIPRIPAEESAIQRLLDSTEDIATTAGEVMLRILDFLSEDNAERIAQTLDNVDSFTTSVTLEGDRIPGIIRNAEKSTESLAGLADDARTTMARLDGAIGKLDENLLDAMPELTRDLQDSLNQLSSLTRRADDILSDNEDALAGFTGEGLSQLGPTLIELRLLMRDLSRMSSQFERNPTRFLLGADQPEEYDPR